MRHMPSTELKCTVVYTDLGNFLANYKTAKNLNTDNVFTLIHYVSLVTWSAREQISVKRSL